MAFMVFHEADDDHAPFPHRVLTIPASTRTVLIHGTRTRAVIEQPEQKFVICANCDHWITRDIGRCDCEYHCHALGILLAEMALHEVESQVKGQEAPQLREARS